VGEYRFCPWCGAGLQSREIDGFDRHACSRTDCDYVYWDNPTPVVAAIVEMDGSVILVRNQGWPEKWFGLVTGFLERGETPEAGIRREVVEELSLDPVAVEFLGLYPFFERNELILAYHVLARGEISLGDELERFKAIPIEKLRPWPFGTGPAVKDWLERR
jgi:NADH pyrophosphatase NudC (nudix superfamily)